MAERTIPIDDAARQRIADMCRNNPRKLSEVLASLGDLGPEQSDDSDPDGEAMLDIGEWSHLRPAPSAYWLLEDIRSPFMVPGAAPTFGDCARAIYIMAGGDAAGDDVRRVREANAALAKAGSAQGRDIAGLAQRAAAVENRLDTAARACYMRVMGERPLDDVAAIIEGLLNAGARCMERVPDAGEAQKKTGACSTASGWLGWWPWLLRQCRRFRPTTRSGESRSSSTASYTSAGSPCVELSWRPQGGPSRGCER